MHTEQTDNTNREKTHWLIIAGTWAHSHQLNPKVLVALFTIPTEEKRSDYIFVVEGIFFLFCLPVKKYLEFEVKKMGKEVRGIKNTLAVILQGA